MAALGCTQPTIRAALRYKSNTPLARKIRFLALKKGGVAVNTKRNIITKQ
ncbi:MAG: hypothetical protein IKJ56_09620 [Bacteroidales bacterium]|nr:hypothetical protein [Bacteroidales bacterium]